MIPTRGYKAPVAKTPMTTTPSATAVPAAKAGAGSAKPAVNAPTIAAKGAAPPKATQSTIARLAVPKNSRVRQASPMAQKSTPGSSPTGLASKRSLPGVVNRRGTGAGVDKPAPAPSAEQASPPPAASRKVKAPNNAHHSVLYDRALAFSEGCAKGYLRSKEEVLPTVYADQFIAHHTSMTGAIKAEEGSHHGSDPALDDTMKARRASKGRVDTAAPNLSSYKSSHSQLLHFMKAQRIVKGIEEWVARDVPGKAVVACVGCGFDSMLLSLAAQHAPPTEITEVAISIEPEQNDPEADPTPNTTATTINTSPIEDEQHTSNPETEGDHSAVSADADVDTDTPDASDPPLPAQEDSSMEKEPEAEEHEEREEAAATPPGVSFVDIDEASVVEKRAQMYSGIPESVYTTMQAESLADLPEALEQLAGSDGELPCRYLFVLDSVLSAMSVERGAVLLERIKVIAEGSPVDVIGWDDVYPQDTYGGIVTAVAEQAGRPLLSVHNFPSVAKVGERLREQLASTGAVAASPYSLLQDLLADKEEMKRITAIQPIGDWEDLTESLLHAVLFSYSSANTTLTTGASTLTEKSAPLSSQQVSRMHFLRKLGDFCLGMSHTVVTCQPTILSKGAHSRPYAAYVYGEGGLTIIDLSLPKLLRGYETPSGNVPVERLYHAAAMAGDYMLLHGGVTLKGELCSKQISLLHVNSLVWSSEENTEEAEGDAEVEVEVVPSVCPGPRQRHCMASLGESEALLFGGMAEGFLADTWVYSVETKSWRELTWEGKASPQPRHSATLTKMNSGDIVLHGGQGETALLSDVWVFQVATLSWRAVEHSGTGWAPPPRMSHATAPADDSLLVVGGSSVHERTGGVGDSDAYLIIFDLIGDKVSFKQVVTDVPVTEGGGGNSMLLTRHLIVPFQPRTFLVMGGGAHCSTYGTFLNKPRIAYLDSSSASGKAFSSIGKQCDAVVRVNHPTFAQWAKIYKKRQPVVMKCDFGECFAKWTPDYLKEKIGEKEVSVGVCKQPELTFHPKNYSFKAMAFSELLKGTILSENHSEYLYFRSVGKNMRKDPANFWDTMPEVADDFKAPGFLQRTLDDEGLFSSALRVSSKDVIIWCHYDITDGMLFQVSGVKHVILFPPEEVQNLYIDGSSSLAGDVTSCDLKTYPLVNKALAKGRHVVLQPGDSLFIPALWFHTTWAQDASISVNIMWKHLPKEVYEKNDLYGNKDLIHAGEAQKTMAKVHAMLEKVYFSPLFSPAVCTPQHFIKDEEKLPTFSKFQKSTPKNTLFLQLPQGYRDFYARKLSSELDSKHFEEAVGCARQEDYAEPIPVAAPGDKPTGTGLSHPVYAGTLSEIVVEGESYGSEDDEDDADAEEGGPTPTPTGQWEESPNSTPSVPSPTCSADRSPTPPVEGGAGGVLHSLLRSSGILPVAR